MSMIITLLFIIYNRYQTSVSMEIYKSYRFVNHIETDPIHFNMIIL